MKIVTEEELQELDKATRRGAAEGILAGLALALPASFYLQRRSQWYRGLPIQLKALGVILVVGPAYAIQTERRAVQFDEERYWGKDYGSETIRSAQSEAELRWKTLSRSEKLKEWTIKNQYSILAGGWALGMAVASGIIWRDRHQTATQKIVQVRMWAQGLTVGLLIGAGILTQTQRKEAAAHRPVDHSWREILEAQAREEEQLKISKMPQPDQQRL